MEPVSNQQKVYNLSLELAEAEAVKKRDAKLHREEITRIKEEIKAILSEND